jgi:chromosome condensin MukBEF complex kleisin-like MukF subunit
LRDDLDVLADSFKCITEGTLPLLEQRLTLAIDKVSLQLEQLQAQSSKLIDKDSIEEKFRSIQAQIDQTILKHTKSTLLTRIDYERDTKKFTKNIHDL